MKVNMLTVPLSKIVAVALTTATLCVAAWCVVENKCSKQSKINVKTLRTLEDGFRQLGLIRPVSNHCGFTRAVGHG